MILWKFRCIIRREHIWYKKFSLCCGSLVIWLCLFVFPWISQRERLSSWIERLSSLKAVWITGVFLRIYTVLLLCTRASSCFSVDQEGFVLTLSLLVQWCIVLLELVAVLRLILFPFCLLSPESAGLVATREELKSGYMSVLCDTELSST